MNTKKTYLFTSYLLLLIALLSGYCAYKWL